MDVRRRRRRRSDPGPAKPNSPLKSGYEGSGEVQPHGGSASPKSKDFTLRQKLGPFPGDLGVGFAL